MGFMCGALICVLLRTSGEKGVKLEQGPKSKQQIRMSRYITKGSYLRSIKRWVNLMNRALQPTIFS